MKKYNKFLMPISILLGSIVFGGFYYLSQLEKQKSIELQQKNEFAREMEIRVLENNQKEKEYIAKRKTECNKIMKDEENAVNVVYDEKADSCFLGYVFPSWMDKVFKKNCGELEKYTTVRGITIYCKDGYQGRKEI